MLQNDNVKLFLGRLSFKIQYKIEFLLLFTGSRIVLENNPDICGLTYLNQLKRHSVSALFYALLFYNSLF